MARKKAAPPDLADLVPPVAHLPVRSLPFTEAWRSAAKARWLELKSMGVTQASFAVWCDCAQASVSNVLGEKPMAFMRTEYLERFSAALEVPLPLRAQLDIEGDKIGDNDEGLAKVLDMIRWFSSSQR